MYKELLKQQLFKKYNQERKGIHVSDIVNCPRQTVFRRLDPRDVTDTELNFFSSGRAIHEAMQELVESDPDRFEIESEISYNGAQGHIDVYDKKENIPIEFKSYRGKIMTEPKGVYVSQLKVYMAITGSDKGHIIVQCLMNFEGNPFVEFIITMDENERKQVLKDFKKKSLQFKIALGEKDPALATHIAYDPIFLDKLGNNWKCKNCPYEDQCKQMRNDERDNIMNGTDGI